MEPLPNDLLASLPEGAAPAAEQWWASLSEADRERIAGLRDLLGERTPVRPWRWRWGLAAAAAYTLASAAYMAAFITPNTSWEHHPFAGPLVALYSSRNYPASLVIWAGLGAGLCWPAFRPSVLAVAGSVASAVAWVVLGVWAAAMASC